MLGRARGGGRGRELETPSSLRETAIRSAAYLTGREVLGVGIRLLGLVLVMRRIGPSDFGLYSAAAAYVVLPATLAQMGAEVFLIRQPGPLPRRRYDEVFTTLLVASGVVVAAGMGISYLVGPLLRPHGVVPPMRVLLLSVPVNILWAPMQARLERRFAFRQLGLLELGGDVVLYGTAVPLAVMGAGPWSLIAGFFAWQSWLLVGSMALSGLWPRLAWSNRTARELIVHGRTFSVTTWVAGVRSAILTMIVGTFAGAAGVGLVNFAQRLVLTMNFTDRGVHRIGLAAISRASESKSGRLAAALEEGTLLLLVISALPFVVFGLFAHWAILVGFGRVWLPALPLYVLLALWATLRVPATAQRTVLYAYGRNGAPAITSVLELVIVSLVALVAVRELGLIGYGIAALAAVASTINTHVAAQRLIPLEYRRLILPLVALASPMFIPLVPIRWGFLLLAPTLALFAVRSTRAELWRLISTAWTTIVRRSREKGTPAPDRGSVAPQPVLTPAQVVLAISGPRIRGAEMAANGAIAPRTATVQRFSLLDALDVRSGVVADSASSRAAERAATLLGHASGEPSSGLPGAPRASWTQMGAGVGPIPRDARSHDAAARFLADTDPVTGLATGAVLLARIGRLLGAVHQPGWSVALVGIEVRRGATAVHGRAASAPEELLATVAKRLRAELRFDDLLARVGSSLFVAVVVVFADPAEDGARVAAHLEGAALAALADEGIPVGSTPWTARAEHLVVSLPCDQNADDLLRRVLGDLDA